jgi:hypothetical protein
MSFSLDEQLDPSSGTGVSGAFDNRMDTPLT